MRRLVLFAAFLLTASVALSITQHAASRTPSGPFVSMSGQITTVNAAQNQILIKDQAGKELTLLIGEKTAITKNGKALTVADLKTGDWVTVEGEQSGDGYKVTSITVMTE